MRPAVLDIPCYHSLQEGHNNVLETICLFCALAFVLCGMIFYPSLDSATECVGTQVTGDSLGICASTMGIKEDFALGLMLLVILTFVLSIACTLYEIHERSLSRQSARSIESVRRWFGAEDRSDKKEVRRANASIRKGRIPGLTVGIHRKSSEGVPRSSFSSSRTPSGAQPLERKPSSVSDGSGMEQSVHSEGPAAAAYDSTATSPRTPRLGDAEQWTDSEHDRSPRSPGNPTLSRTGSEGRSGSGDSGNGGPDDDTLRLHLSHMLDGFYLSNWRMWLKEMEKRDQNIRIKYHVGNPTSPLGPQERAYLQVDDDLPASVCLHFTALGNGSNSSMSASCRSFIQMFPGLIDYLCTADPAARNGLFSFLKDYLSFASVRPVFESSPFLISPDEHPTPDGAGRERLVLEEYKSILCDWLIHAEPDEVAVFNGLLTSIARCSGLPESGRQESRRQSIIDAFKRFRRHSMQSFQVEAPHPSSERTSVEKTVAKDVSAAHAGNSEDGSLTASFVELITPRKAAAPQLNLHEVGGGANVPQLSASFVEIVTPRRTPRMGATSTIVDRPAPATPRVIPRLVPEVGRSGSPSGTAEEAALVREISVEAAAIRFPTPRRMLEAEAAGAPVAVGSTPIRYSSPVPLSLAATNGFSSGGSGGSGGAGGARFYDVESAPTYDLRRFAASVSPTPPPASTLHNRVRRLDFLVPPPPPPPRRTTPAGNVGSA